MRLDREENIEVARRASAQASLAVTDEADLGAVLDTGRRY